MIAGGSSASVLRRSFIYLLFIFNLLNLILFVCLNSFSQSYKHETRVYRPEWRLTDSPIKDNAARLEIWDLIIVSLSGLDKWLIKLLLFTFLPVDESINHTVIIKRWHEWEAIYLFWLTGRIHHLRFPCIKNCECKSGFVRARYQHSLPRSHVLSIRDWSSFCFRHTSLFLCGVNMCRKRECYIPSRLCQSVDGVVHTEKKHRVKFICVSMQREERKVIK